MNVRELREKRSRAVHEARVVVETAEAEKRALTAEEQEQYDRLMAEQDELRGRIERAERIAALDEELDARADEPLTQRENAGGEAAPEQFRFVSRGLAALNEQNVDWRSEPAWQALLRTNLPAYRKGFSRFVRYGEQRALQVDSDTAGGYLTAPVQWVDRLIQAIDNQTFIRQWATVIAVPTAQSLGAPSLETDPADPTWTAEIATGTEDSSMAFGRRELFPHPLAKRLKVSKRLLRVYPNAENLVRDRLAYKFAVTFENAALNGSGSNQPLGIFTASAQGINTDRDAATGNTTTAVTFDGLIEAKYTLKQQYWPNARWLAHSDFYKMVAKLKDDDGQYLWRESVRAGEPDMLLGMPSYFSAYAPNTFTTGLYVGVLADFSQYWIADALDMQIQRLVELYSETNQDGFIGRLESDGLPVLSEAFVRVTLGT